MKGVELNLVRMSKHDENGIKTIWFNIQKWHRIQFTLLGQRKIRFDNIKNMFGFLVHCFVYDILQHCISISCTEQRSLCWKPPYWHWWNLITLHQDAAIHSAFHFTAWFNRLNKCTSAHLISLSNAALSCIFESWSTTPKSIFIKFQSVN